MNEQPQYKVWKATLRNALHKHPHIQEVKEYGKSGLFRVYQITGKSVSRMSGRYDDDFQLPSF